MEEITVHRKLDSPPEAVGDALQDLEPFMKAAGFDKVEVENNLIHVENQVGIATIELSLEIVDGPDADLSYEQREGIFEEMRTTYNIAPTATGTEITATTQFALDVAIVGNVLDSTIIKRQRRKELTAQFDWLEEVLSD